MKAFFAVCFFLVSAISALSQELAYTSPLGMEFVLIKSGTFTVGKFQPTYPVPGNDGNKAGGYNAEDYALAEKLAKSDASTGFPVMIESAFYMGKYEVTQAEWKKVMGGNPSIFKGDKDADRHPVDNVTWEDAQAFIRKLNAMHKGYVYRLPTEFEWEYAARAGADDDIAWSDIRLMAQLGMRSTQLVGQKKPNEWGLFDMLGNVWEWVQDFYNEKMFADPVPARSGKVHGLKGASFVGDVKNATYMTHAAGPGNRWDVGFRVVLEVSK